MSMKDVLRSVRTTHGERYVMTAGATMMQLLSADNLATLQVVWSS